MFNDDFTPNKDKTQHKNYHRRLNLKQCNRGRFVVIKFLTSPVVINATSFRVGELTRALIPA
jgi:hypothetical protein